MAVRVSPPGSSLAGGASPSDGVDKVGDANRPQARTAKVRTKMLDSFMKRDIVLLDVVARLFMRSPFKVVAQSNPGAVGL